ncbi:MAG: M20/M25/M40 family metallo-hydrolase, partial [Lentisphaeria bacterium]|nr:M20/M25/M40 family metallo-hydrolase [Lentisphaeria bacterium]
MLTSAEQKLRDAVNEANLVRFCQELVRIPTVNPYSGDQKPSGESAGLAYIEEYCRKYGAEIIRIPCDDAACDRRDLLCPRGRQNENRENVAAKFVFGSGKGPVLMLDAHMDTVAAETFDGDPFSGELDEEGFIHGRGSSDDKSSVAVMMEVIRILCENPPAGLDGTLYCCFVTEEECDGSGRGSMACLDALPKPDAAIVLDGAFGTVLSGASGILTVRIEVPGKSGHAAYGAVSAIDQALKLAPAFAKFKSLRPAEPGMLNWGVFHAGNHPANVPERAVLGLNLRTLPADADASEAKYGVRSARLVRELFESCVAEAAADDPFLKDNPPRVIWVKDLPGE